MNPQGPGIAEGEPEMTVLKTVEAVFGICIAVLIGIGALIVAGVMALVYRAKSLATTALS